MTQVLYRKWRPMTFEEVVGQDHITQTLKNALALGRVAHAYLFSGPRGTGKTTTARLLAKAVNCLAESLADRPCNVCRPCTAVNEGRFLDLIEIDAASNTGVDDVRDLREKIGFSPNEGRYKVYIVDEVHMLSTAAFNALLKTLEEPPAHAIFVLATTEVQKIPATVLSRCQRFEFRRIPLPQIVARLESLLGNEGVGAEPGALDLIARQATGALRDAESLLDQVLSSQPGDLSLAQVQAVLGTASSQVLEQVVDSWVDGETAAGLVAIQSAVDAGSDPQQVSRQMVDYLRGLLLFKAGETIPSEIAESSHEPMRTQAQALTVEELVAAVRRFSASLAEGKGGWQPQLPLELAFIESVNQRIGRDRAAVGAPAAEMAPMPAARPARPVAEPAPFPPVRPRSPSPSSIAPADIEARWDELLTRVKQRDFRVEAMLRSGQGVLGVEGGVVVLGFRYSLHRDKIESDEWRPVVEDSLSEVMGLSLRIRCVDPQSYEAPPVAPASSPEAPDPEAIKRFAVEELDAQVIEPE